MFDLEERTVNHYLANALLHHFRKTGSLLLMNLADAFRDRFGKTGLMASKNSIVNHCFSVSHVIHTVLCQSTTLPMDLVIVLERQAH
jgi:hypothetical protein